MEDERSRPRRRGGPPIHYREDAMDVTLLVDTDDEGEERMPPRRISSRRCTNPLPSSSLMDIDEEAERAMRRRSSPQKSPARRHIQQRRSLEHSDSESEADDDDEEEEDATPLRIQRILASRTETLRRWKDIGRDMNTSEIHYGSRWYQEEDAPDLDENTFQERFLVQWSDLSHLHVSWETENDLMDQVPDAKLYFNTFFRKAVYGFLYSPDERCDGEYFDPAYTEIDRILEVSSEENEYGILLDKNDPHFDHGTGRQFLIKWRNLPYTDMTYEFERDLIMNEIEFKDALAEYLQRTTKPTKLERRSFLREGELEYKRLYKIFGSQSTMSDRETAVEEYKQKLQQHVYKNGGQLRDYQAEGVAWMLANFVNQRNSILADEMGLGKTLQTAAVAQILTRVLNRGGPVLIVAPLSTLTHWHREFLRWTDLNAVVYHGSAEDRKHIREHEFVYPCDRPDTELGFNQVYLRKCVKKLSSLVDSPWMVDVVITSPEMMIADDVVELAAVQWEVLVVDEAHRMKNYNSKLSVGLRNEKFTFRHRILLTGTPIQNDVQEFWALMNFIDAERYESLDDFLASYGEMQSKERVDELHEEIRPYILRRLKEDVEKSVPPKEETLIEVELTVAQKQYYRALYEKNVKFLHKNNKKALDGPSLNNLAMQLRKCCNHVFLLNGVEEEFRRQHGNGIAEADFLVMGSGKLILLDKLLPRLKEEGHRVLLFSQFKIMLDILEDYLKARGMQFERIDGSITGRKRQQAIDRFQAPSSESRAAPFIMLLSTRAGGVGITLTAADTCIIVDSDWNPQNDLQAQARCHRIGQTKSVKVYRLLSRKTYEMQMFHMSSLKMGLDQVVLKGFENGASGEGALTKAEVERLLRVGAYDIFNEEKAGESEAESKDFVQQDIDSILQRRSHTIVHENTGSHSSSAGGTFSKASFKSKTDGIDNFGEDVDIEDPDFWKKMIGEGNTGESAKSMEKRRTRPPMNYSEMDYHRQLDAALSLKVDNENLSFKMDGSDVDDDSSADLNSGEFLPKDWSKANIEYLAKALTTFGYGRLPWEELMKRAKLSKIYDEIEFTRMCWTIILASVLEAVDDSTELFRKREAKRVEKAREIDAVERGGVLSVNRSLEISREDMEKRKSEEFRKIWDESSNWIGKVFKDASSFASSNAPRSMPQHISDCTVSSRRAVLTTELELKFKSNVWPLLKSRGWKSGVASSEEGKTKSTYCFRENEYFSINSVLVAGKSFHPEISNVMESLDIAVESLRNLNDEPCPQETAMLSQENVSVKAIHCFIECYGSAQLTQDRRKSSRVRLPRAVLSSNAVLYTADALVRRAASSAGSFQASIQTLAKNLSIEKRTALPHPMWTQFHDSVLIHAISMHGWIDQDSAVRAIADDNSIKWGAPFDSGIVVSPGASNSNVHLVADSAERVAEFFNKHSSLISELNSFNQQHVVTAYGLRRLVLDDERGISRWTVDGFGKSADCEHDKFFDLPPKKDLVRRAKAILGKNATILPASNDASVSLSLTHGYTVLDQRNGSNVFLAEILRAILKEPTNSVHIKSLCSLASEEARFLAASLRKLESGDANDSALSLLRIAVQVDEARKHFARHFTQSKNIIRVTLGEEALKSRNKNENLFPPKSALPSLETTIAVKRKRPSNLISSSLSSGEESIKASRDRFMHRSSKVGSRASSPSLNLELTEIETIILSVACLVGIPVWVNDWESKFWGKTVPSTSSICDLSWERFGKVVTAFAEKSLEEAANILKSQHHDCEVLAWMGSSDFDVTKESDLKKTDINLKCNEMVVIQAKEYMQEPEILAKKAIMLLEKLRRHMGVVVVSLLTTRSDNGLGSKVLVWFRKELLKWATSLDLLDESGQPLAYTAVEFLEELPESSRLTIDISSLIDKKGSRNIFAQSAMISRLRSIYSSVKISTILERIEEINSNLAMSNDSWKDQPAMWNANFDIALVKRLLEDGLDETLVHSSSPIQDVDGRMLSISRFSDCQLSKLALQARANQLARELHVLELACRASLLDDRRTERITPVEAKTPPNDSNNINVSLHGNNLMRCDSDDEVELISPPRSQLYSDVEIVESWLTGTRQNDSKGGVVVDKKKHRSL